MVTTAAVTNLPSTNKSISLSTPPPMQAMAPNGPPGPRYTMMTSNRGNSRSGRWTPDEKLLFLHGLKIYGRGRWKKIRQFLPTRSLIQIKSHAQKVLKREEAGDEVFVPLKANKDKVEALVKDKSRLFMQNNPSLMSSDGRYHTITTGHLHVSKPIAPAYQYYKSTVGSSGMPPFSFVPSENITPEQQQQHMVAAHAPVPHASLMRHHHHQPPPQHHHMQHACHMQHPHPMPPHHMPHLPPPPQQHQQPLPLPHAQHQLHQQVLSGPPPQQQLPQLQNPPQHQQQQQPVAAAVAAAPQAAVPDGKQKSPKTTDVLAATALCELFRAGNSEKDLDEAHEEAAKNEQNVAAAAAPATPEPATATAV